MQLPLGSVHKKLLCVVATVSLGVGVDIRVDNAVVFGLADTAENLIQEGGREMRGSCEETSGKHGYAYFFHKGRLGKGRVQKKIKIVDNSTKRMGGSQRLIFH